MSQVNEQVISFCLQELKKAFRVAGITYQDIGSQLGMSLATVKRMMADENIRFDRLLTLCQLAGVEITELIDSAVNKPAEHSVFTHEQDAAFAQFPHLLSYFSALVYQRETPADIAKQYQLDDVSTYLYLRKLETIGLIELLPENKVKLTISLPVGFSADSQVMKQQYQSMIEHTVQSVLFDDSSDAFCLVKPMYLSDSLYTKMLNEINNIVDKYSEISEVMVDGNVTDNRQLMVLGCKPDQQEFADIIAVSASALNMK